MAWNETCGTNKLTWDLVFPRILENICKHLRGSEVLVASTVCRGWADLIENCPKTLENVAINLVKCDGAKVLHLINPNVLQSKRRYSHISLQIDRANFTSSSLWKIVKQLNEKNELKGAKIKVILNISEECAKFLTLLHANLPNLENLNLSVNVCRSRGSFWSQEFEAFSNLMTLSLANCDEQVMESIQRHCTKLIKLTLTNFATADRLQSCLKLPDLEELEIEVPPSWMGAPPFETLELPKLKYLALQGPAECFRMELYSLNLHVPALRTLHVSLALVERVQFHNVNFKLESLSVCITCPVCSHKYMSKDLRQNFYPFNASTIIEVVGGRRVDGSCNFCAKYFSIDKRSYRDCLAALDHEDLLL